MSRNHNRRQFLAAAVASGLSGAALAGGSETAAAATAPAGTGSGGSAPPVTVVSAGDPRYGALATRGMNRRFTASPDVFYLPTTTEQVRAAVDASISAGRKIAVRSGGHCADDLVDDPSNRAIIDVSGLGQVSFDAARGAFVVESGALLGDVYTKLSSGWNRVLPGGTCPTVGVGGYVAGGGFGSLCRKYGLCADHLYGVEVVHVDRARRANVVLATRETRDPNRELWWALTGSGGGNFGVITRYLFRSPGMDGRTPERGLPPLPGPVLVTTMTWPWTALSESVFTRLLANHGAWHAANSAPGTPTAALYSGFVLEQRTVGAIALIIEVGTDNTDAARVTADYLAAVTAGVDATPTTNQTTMSWLDAAHAGLYGGSASALNRSKGKGAYLRRPYTNDQARLIYDRLSSDANSGLGALVLYSYGGQINALRSDAGANPHRDSILLADLVTYWSDAATDDQHVAWARQFYADLYAGTGGVPAPGPATDGSYINYPDVDLADPAINTSGVPWSTLYFGGNYQRLQRVKAAYDPTDTFRHHLSIAPPSAGKG
jgi:aclacinomycin oxidase